jgi:hypothetical protein
MTTPKQTTTLRLTLVVEYDLQGESVKALKENLWAIPRAATSNGDLTDDTNAEVISWDAEVEEINK